MTIAVSTVKAFTDGFILLDHQFVGDLKVSDPAFLTYSDLLDYEVRQEDGETRIYRKETGLIETETRLKVTIGGTEYLRMFGDLPYLSFPSGVSIAHVAPVATVTYEEGVDYDLDPLLGTLTERPLENGGRIRNVMVSITYVTGDRAKVYATVGDFIDRFEMSEALELTNLDTAKEPKFVRCTKIWKALEHATYIIQQKLSTRFDIEVMNADSLNWICLDIARYWLDELRQREDVRKRYEDALEALREIADGKAGLGTVEEQPTGARASHGKGSSTWVNNLEGF